MRTILTPLRRVSAHRRWFSNAATAQELAQFQLFNPTEEHASLREMLRNFVETEVDPQALEYNRTETFNHELFKKLGDLGLLGVTVPVEYGGSGMDAAAACIVHGKFQFLLFVVFSSAIQLLYPAPALFIKYKLLINVLFKN